MQENEYKSHHVLVGHQSPFQVLPAHLNTNAINWYYVNCICEISVKWCKPVIVTEYLLEFSGVEKNTKLRWHNS